MPLNGRPMTIEPTYPKAAELMAMCRDPKIKAEIDAESHLRVRNRFYSSAKHGDVVIFEKNGKIDWGVEQFNPVATLLGTLDCADAWGIEQEGNAVDALGKLLRHHNFKQYLLTGMFMESSARSGVVYLFRRLRPTIAITLRGEEPRILAALCMHAIGYYEGTWAGAMTPTDEVIAHLALMRGDEAMFWRRCNQHAPWRASAGINL